MSWTNLRAELAPRTKTAGIAWREAGKVDPILLLHGAGLNADVWEPQILHLANKRRVIAADLPGHGGSDPLPTDAKLEDFVKAIAALIDELELAPLPVIGHGLGAMIALGLALDHPVQVACLVAISPVYGRDPSARTAVKSAATRMASGAVDAMGPIDRWFPDAKDGPQARGITRWLRAMKAKSYATALAAYAEADKAYEGRLDKIKCRTLFMTGVADPDSTPAMATRMAKEAPHAHMVSITRARHMLMLTHPAETNAAVSGFLNEAWPEA